MPAPITRQLYEKLYKQIHGEEAPPPKAPVDETQATPNISPEPSAIQPKWKWSYDGRELKVWPVDPIYGQPHHIEITGPHFYRFAQGRIYENTNGTYDVTVWEDRGSNNMQDEAITAVDHWLFDHTGNIANDIHFLSEGGVYDEIDKENPDWDSIMQAYFGKQPEKGTKEYVLNQSPDALANNYERAWQEDPHEQLNQAWQEAMDRDAAVLV